VLIFHIISYHTITILCFDLYSKRQLDILQRNYALFAIALVSTAQPTCLCGAVSLSSNLLASLDIPISTVLCHCNACRQTTSALAVSFLELDEFPPTDTSSKLTAYYSSPSLTRYFCITCGCHCFLSRGDTWYCLSGIVEASFISQRSTSPWTTNIVKIERHNHVFDTLDGGLAPILLTMNGRVIPADLPSKFDSIPPPPVGAFLQTKCHCMGVSLLIKRANYSASLQTPADSSPTCAHVGPVGF